MKLIFDFDFYFLYFDPFWRRQEYIIYTQYDAVSRFSLPAQRFFYYIVSTVQ